MIMMDVKLEAFEGPLALLCHLIDKHEINIYDIPIAQLADQYLEFIELHSMEGISEFVVMAAHLLEIKSRMLLPRPTDDEEEDPRQQLMNQLIEYKRFQAISEALGKREGYYERSFYREKDKEIEQLFANLKPRGEEYLEGLSLDRLFKVFNDVMKRKALSVDTVRSDYGRIKRDSFTVAQRMEYIRQLLLNKKILRFTKLFDEDSTKEEVIVTFLALLEMIKQRLIRIRQEEIFDEIHIERGEAH